MLPALKQVMEICKLFGEAPASYGQSYPSGGRVSHIFYRHQVINELQQKHSIVMTVATSLVQYINQSRVFHRGMADEPLHYGTTILPPPYYYHHNTTTIILPP